MSENLRLGTTSVGDLLLRKRISKTTAGEPLTGVSLRIPEYQRPYKWSAKNASQLLDDIEDAMAHHKQVYRVGTIILHYSGDDTYDIVDGQQRTITFSLLLLALHEEVDFLEEKLSDNPYSIHNVRNNYRTLLRRIGQPEIQEDTVSNVEEAEEEKFRQELKKYIENKCEFVIVITDDLSEAFQFFDSQNARGKALYPHDLLKAYHLREMTDLDEAQTEQTVKTWEDLDQQSLARLFNDYLYRLKRWIHGDWAYELNEQSIDMFKGLTRKDTNPYAKFYKGAFAYADQYNRSQLPFVTGGQEINPFQIDAPVIAGKPFFDYTKHYFDVLADIRNNDKYEGYLINDNQIVRTLDQRKYKNGVGNRATRLMFDTAILLYADRFCTAAPSQEEEEYLNRFVDYAFVWAYSMRAQYLNVGWQVAQNYILGKSSVKNSFNIYKEIADAISPQNLLNRLADRIMPLDQRDVRKEDEKSDLDKMENGTYLYYLHFFKTNHFWGAAE